MAAYGLYTHIQANRRLSIALLGGLFLLIYVMVFAGALAARAVTEFDAPLDILLADAWRDLIAALPYATIGAAVWIAIAYRFHQAMIDGVTGGRTVTRRDEPRLYNLLENLCISRGIAMPKLKVMPSAALNAFASGLNERQYAITVTTGLIENLDDAEVEAVLGHELTHIRNGDVRMLVIALIIAGVIGFVAELALRLLWYRSFHVHRGGSGSGTGTASTGTGDGRSRGSTILAIAIAIALVALAWLLSQVIRFSLSRRREFLADAGAVELTKNPDAMIGALRKIENRGELPGVTSSVMEMCVDNPHEGFVDLFATHPPIEKRIEALVRYAGGRDPGPLALPEPEPAASGSAGPELPPADRTPLPNPWSPPPQS